MNFAKDIFNALEEHRSGSKTRVETLWDAFGGLLGMVKEVYVGLIMLDERVSNIESAIDLAIEESNDLN